MAVCSKELDTDFNDRLVNLDHSDRVDDHLSSDNAETPVVRRNSCNSNKEDINHDPIAQSQYSLQKVRQKIETDCTADQSPTAGNADNILEITRPSTSVPTTDVNPVWNSESLPCISTTTSQNGTDSQSQNLLDTNNLPQTDSNEPTDNNVHLNECPLTQPLETKGNKNNRKFDAILSEPGMSATSSDALSEKAFSEVQRMSAEGSWDAQQAESGDSIKNGTHAVPFVHESSSLDPVSSRFVLPISAELKELVIRDDDDDDEQNRDPDPDQGQDHQENQNELSTAGVERSVEMAEAPVDLTVSTFNGDETLQKDADDTDWLEVRITDALIDYEFDKSDVEQVFSQLATVLQVLVQPNDKSAALVQVERGQGARLIKMLGDHQLHDMNGRLIVRFAQQLRNGEIAMNQPEPFVGDNTPLLDEDASAALLRLLYESTNLAYAEDPNGNKTTYADGHQNYGDNDQVYAHEEPPYANNEQPFISNDPSYGNHEQPYGNYEQPYPGRDQEPFANNEQRYGSNGRLHVFPMHAGGGGIPDGSVDNTITNHNNLAPLDLSFGRLFNSQDVRGGLGDRNLHDLSPAYQEVLADVWALNEQRLQSSETSLNGRSYPGDQPSQLPNVTQRSTNSRFSSSGLIHGGGGTHPAVPDRQADRLQLYLRQSKSAHTDFDNRDHSPEVLGPRSRFQAPVIPNSCSWGDRSPDISNGAYSANSFSANAARDFSFSGGRRRPYESPERRLTVGGSSGPSCFDDRRTSFTTPLNNTSMNNYYFDTPSSNEGKMQMWLASHPQHGEYDERMFMPELNPNPPSESFHERPLNNGDQSSSTCTKVRKWTARYDIQIPTDNAFQVTRRIIGTRGINMKRINQLTGAKLRLRGRGSGYLEGSSRLEADDPLHLCISCCDSNKYRAAKQMVDKLLRQIYLDYDAWSAEVYAVAPRLSLQVREVFLPNRDSNDGSGLAENGEPKEFNMPHNNNNGSGPRPPRRNEYPDDM